MRPQPIDRGLNGEEACFSYAIRDARIRSATILRGSRLIRNGQGVLSRSWTERQADRSVHAVRDRGGRAGIGRRVLRNVTKVRDEEGAARVERYAPR